VRKASGIFDTVAFSSKSSNNAWV